MAEYISRETLLKAVEKMDRLDKESTPYEYDKEGYILLIENAPTADVTEVRHGEWLLKHRGVGHYWECSECEYMECTKPRQKYCPNCGAKMDGGKAE